MSIPSSHSDSAPDTPLPSEHAGSSSEVTSPRPVDEEIPMTADLGAMLRLAAPIIVIQSTIVAMQFVDGLMLAQLGAKELAAILPAFITVIVVLSLGMGILNAVGTFVSQSLGKGDTAHCGHYAWQGNFICLAYGLACLPLIPLADTLFWLYGHEASVRALEVEYFQIAVLRVAPSLMVSSISSFYTGIHKPLVLAFAAVVGMVLNIFFNWLLIFGNWGFPAMGIAGASWATLAAILVQLGLLLLHFLSARVAQQYGTRRIRLDLAALWKIIRVGMPAGAQFLIDILSWGVALTYMVGLFGTAHLAASSIAVNYMHLAFMPPIGLGIILLAMVGRSIGAGKHDLAAAQVRTGARACLLYMGSLGLLFIVFREPLLRLYTDDPQIIAIGMSVMIAMAACQLFDAFNIIYTFSLRGAGDTFWPAVYTFALVVIVMIGGCLYFVNYQPQLGSIGPWIAGAAYIGGLGAVMWARWQLGAWRAIDIFHK